MKTEDELEVRRVLADDAERVAQTGSYVWDPPSGRVLWSDNCFRMLGLEPDVEPSTALLMSRVHPDDATRVAEAFRRAAESSVAPPLEYRLVVDDTVKHVLARAVAVRDAQGNVVRMVGTIQDVTHQHERARALEIHSQLLEQAQALAHVGSYVWTLDSGRVSWSPELYRILGVDPSQVPSIEAFDAAVNPDDLQMLKGARRRLLEDHVASPFELRVLRKNGGLRRVVMHARYVDESDPYIVGVVHDVTEQRELADRLQRRETLEVLGRLANGVAHDFNNALTVIIGGVELAMHTGAVQTGAVPELEYALRAAISAGELAQRLLSLGRPKPGPMGAFELGAAVRSGASLLRRVLPERISLSVEVNGEAVIRGDQRQLDQVLLNLILNARDAIVGEGHIWLTTTVEDGFAVLDVADDGAGMDDATLARALEPFFTTKATSGGTGMGLAMVQEAIQTMSGTVTIEHRAPRGTRLIIRFPSYRARAVALEEPRSNWVEGLRVMIVEDDRAVLELVTRILARSRAEVVAYPSPREAVADEQSYDVVLSDVMMPDGGGELLASTFGKKTPLVFMTGYAERPSWLTPYPVVIKPFMPEELLTALAAAARRAR